MSEEYQQSDDFALKCMRFDLINQIQLATEWLNSLLEDARRLGIEVVDAPRPVKPLSVSLNITPREEILARVMKGRELGERSASPN